MALTLAQSAVISSDDLQRGVLETFVIESPVLDRIPLKDISGNAYSYNSESALPGVAFRGVNEAYIESTGAFNQKFESLVILGGDADVDRFIIESRSNLNDQRALQTAMKVKSMAYRYQDAFINGDVVTEPKGFDGLKKRLVGSQVIDAAPNGMNPVAGGHDFLDQLDGLVNAVNGGADVLYANRRVISKILSAGRRVGGADFVREDITGKRVPTWNGIPLLDIGNRADGTPIIGQDETQGTSTTSSSIYAVKFGQDEGDGGVTGLTRGGVSVRDLGEVDDKPVYRTRVEFYCGMALFSGKGAARLRGVLA